MYTCIYIHIYICIYIYIHIYLYIYRHIYILHMYIHTYVYTRIYKHVYINIYMYIHIGISDYICRYTAGGHPAAAAHSNVPDVGQGIGAQDQCSYAFLAVFQDPPMCLY